MKRPDFSRTRSMAVGEVSDTAALYMIHPHRSKEAFVALIDDWEASSSVMATACTAIGCRRGKPAWPISSVRPGASQPGTIPIWWPVAHGRSPSCSVSVIWPRPHPRGGEWGQVRGGFARRLLREMDSLWVFLAQHGMSQPTTGRNGPYDLASSGANAPKGPPAPRAIAGWSGSCPSKKRVVYRHGLPIRCWWMQ